MAGANVNLGVSGIADFKRNIKDAKATVDAFSEALKLNEKQAETSSLYVDNKIALMKQQIEAQTQVVAEQQRQLELMLKTGTSPTSAAYQKVLGQKYSETAKLEDMKKALNDVEAGANGATSGLNSVDETVDTISKNQAWQNVSEGIGKVTDTLEKGARAAMNFGRKIINSLKSSTGWADDLKTMSDAYDIPMDKLQRMEKVSYIVETDTDAILTARQRMAKAVSGEGREDIADLLGINITGNEDPEDLMWDIGEALLNMDNALERDAAAQKIFGRNWREFVPLFKTGREEYEKMLSEQSVLSDEQIQNLTKADDAIKSMELEIQTLKNEFWSKNAPIITELFEWLIKNKETVVGVIEAIGIAFGGLKLAELAANIGKIVSGFKALGMIKGGEEAVTEAGKAAAAAASGGIASNLSTFLTSGKGIISTAALLGYPMMDKILNGDMRTAEEIEKETMKILGGEGVVDIYNKLQSQGLSKPKEQDWRPSYMQGQRYDNYTGPTAIGDEVIHKDRRTIQTFDQYTASMDRMAAVTEQASASEIQANSEMTAAIGNLEGLPAAVAAAVQAGMSNVTIVIGEGAVGAISRRISGNMARNVVAMTK